MKKWINIFCLLCILFFLSLYFKPEYIFNKNVITGGDTPSHYGLAYHVVKNKNFFGWMPGNFSGFPTFQFYPPISFFLIALTHKALPLQVAFKLIMVLGIFLLPVASFYCLKTLGFSFPAPILGSVFSLIFLFNEGNSMWGGNILSTLAGEFSYSLGYALALACLGMFYRYVSSGKGGKCLAILLAVTGLTHGYPFLFIIMVSSFFLIVSKDLKGMFLSLSRVYTLTFLIMGFWIIPALFYFSYTTPFNFVWRFENAKEIFPTLYFPLIIIIILSHTYLLLSKRMQLRIVYLWYAVLISLVAYLLGVRSGLVDIRFFPFAQGILAMLAATGIGECLRRLKAVGLIPIVITLLTLTGISWHTKLAEPWISYNFTGFEEKPLWKEFIEVNTYLKGSEADPRVVYEHSPEHERAGTVRAFELLPMFSGRSTLEGLYMQSTISSPFVYYIQSEVSQAGSHPLLYYNYPRFDLKKAARHLKLFNVSHFITITEPTQNAVFKEKAFELEKEISPYKIFRLKENEGKYVIPLKYRPIIVESKDWKRLFFNWFRLSKNNVFLICAGKNKVPDGYDPVLSSTLDVSNLSAIPLNGEVIVEEEVRSQEIIIETSKLGHPLLVKVSYHPNWRVKGAKRVYLTSPGFMIIFPDSHKVRLHYGFGLFNYLGWIASLLGLLIVCLPLLPYAGIKPGLTLGLKWRWLICTGLMIVIIGLGLHFHYDAHTLYQNGLNLFNRKDYEKAQRRFLKGIKEFPFSPAIDGTYLYYGLCYYKKGQWKEAIDIWSDFLKEYPEARTADEVLYHIGLSYQFLGQRQKARAIFSELQTNFPNSRFSALIQ